MKRATYQLTFILFILLFNISVKSQTLFEIKFTDRQKVQYSCFLVYFNESNAYMRIAYYNNNNYTVVNVSYTSKNGTNAQGTKYSMFSGYNPVFITSNTSNLTYNPDYFIWFYDNATQTWGKPYTTDDATFNPTNYVIVDSYTKLDPKNITDEYLRRYFGNYEADYLSLKKMCGLTNVVVTDNTNTSSKLHLVFIANTLDPTIGMGCNADETNLRNEFRQVATALGVTYQEYVVDGYTYSKEKVLSTLNSVTPGSNDIVMFIYRGHGFRWDNQTEDWPRMDLRTSSYGGNVSNNNSMNLTEVYTILKNKGARLNIILGDCCNSVINASSVTANNFLTFQVDNNSDINKLKNLFLKTSGIILSSAAQKGEVSWNTVQGGLYSISFLQSLRESISYLSNEVCNWNNILTKTITLARSKSTPTFCTNCTLQNGIMYINVANQ